MSTTTLTRIKPPIHNSFQCNYVSAMLTKTILNTKQLHYLYAFKKTREDLWLAYQFQDLAWKHTLNFFVYWSLLTLLHSSIDTQFKFLCLFIRSYINFLRLRFVRTFVPSHFSTKQCTLSFCTINYCSLCEKNPINASVTNIKHKFLQEKNKP